jgi:hypothetical protein
MLRGTIRLNQIGEFGEYRKVWGTRTRSLDGRLLALRVDMALFEVNAYMRRANVDAVTAIHDILGMDVPR